MYYITFTAKRKNAKRHIAERIPGTTYKGLEYAIRRLKEFHSTNNRYHYDIYTGDWKRVDEDTLELVYSRMQEYDKMKYRGEI